MFQSEINCLTWARRPRAYNGAPRTRREQGRDEPQAELSKKIELISGLWALRIAAVVATLYIVVGYGVVTSAWVTGGIALLFYGVQYVELRGDSGPQFGHGVVHAAAHGADLCGRVRVACQLSGGVPVPRGAQIRARYLWMFQVLVTVVSAAIVLGYAFSVPEIRDAYGCYADESFMQLGSRGICPQSPLGAQCDVPAAERRDARGEPLRDAAVGRDDRRTRAPGGAHGPGRRPWRVCCVL